MLIAVAVLAVKVEKRIRIMCITGIFRKINNPRRLKPCLFYFFFVSSDCSFKK